MIGDTNVRVMPILTGTQISTLEVGTLVKVNEHGAPVEYIIVQQGLPDAMYDASCDGCWLLRKDIAETRTWDDTNNDYQNSDIHAYLNGDWTSRYESGILSQIKQVKIPYQNGTGPDGSVASGANGLSCKFFLLGCYEVGWTTDDGWGLLCDGAKLSYFSSGSDDAANNKRIANYNGSATYWWLRTPFIADTHSAWSVLSNGYCVYWPINEIYGVRPAFILPSTALVDGNFNIIYA